MPRAFFKTVNGKRRWRIVTAGKNADDLNLDPNFVVFDSEFTSTLTVYQSGVFTIPSQPAGPNGSKVLKWPALPYIPLALVNLSTPDTGIANFDTIVATEADGTPMATLAVSADGLNIWGKEYFHYPITVWYVVFRIAA